MIIILNIIKLKNKKKKMKFTIDFALVFDVVVVDHNFEYQVIVVYLLDVVFVPFVDKHWT